MNKKIINKSKGFTLIEIVISIALLSIVIIPFSNLALNSFMITNDAKIKQQATNIAQKYMEKIKSDSTINFDNVSDGLEALNVSAYPTSTSDGFTIKYYIVRDENYKVTVPTAGIDINVYDYRVEISNGGDWVYIYNKDIESYRGQYAVPNFKVTNDLGTTGPGNITFKINETQIPYIKKSKTDSANIIVRVDINRNFSGNILTVTAENKCSGNLIFYFVKSAALQADVKCQIVNLGGNIIKYDNLSSSASTGPMSRLYKIKIEVEKKGQKVVNESYSTFY